MSPSTVPGRAVLLTVEEAAKRLRIGRTSMYRLVSTGAIGKYSEIVWLPMSRIASTSTNADRLTGLPNTYGY